MALKMKVFLFFWSVCLCSFCSSQTLPDPTERFPYRTSLDPEGNFILRWNFDESQIAFEIIANTLGYVGLGISNTGRMAQSDIFVAYVKNDEVHYGDFYAKGHGQPGLDSQQDWNLLYGYEERGKTIVGVIRKLDTCDLRDDNPIKKGNVKLIYAYDHNDPVSLRSFDKHSSKNRGSKTVRLLVPPPEPAPPTLPNDTRTLDFSNANFPIPTNETSSFECFIFNMSHNKVKHHIVKVEPVFDPSTKNIVNSMTLYRCYVPDEKVFFHTGQHYSCFSNPPDELQFCQEYVAGFQQDSEAVHFPEDVGIGIGGEGEPNVYILAVHYENKNQILNMADNSGIRISYTKSLRPHEGAFFTMGNVVSDYWYQFIPPGEKEFQSTAYCSHKCINWGQENAPAPRMTTVGVVLQSHDLGRQMKLRHISESNQTTIEHPWLTFDETFDHRKQKLKVFDTRTPLQTTDSLLLECTYDSSARSTYTLGGRKTNNELCLAHVLYYPRKNIEGCMSWSNLEELKSEHGQVLDPSQAFTTLKNTNWTDNDFMRDNLRRAFKTSVQLEQCWSSFQDPAFAFSHFNPPTIPSPYAPAYACPKTGKQ